MNLLISVINYALLTEFGVPERKLNLNCNIQKFRRIQQSIIASFSARKEALIIEIRRLCFVINPSMIWNLMTNTIHAKHLPNQ